MPKSLRTLTERFEEKWTPEPNTGCWLWTACLNSSGYGSFSIGNGKAILAHRYSYSEHVNEIPEGMHVCHTCDVRCCVNPDHLWLGTHNDNMIDRERKGRGATVGERNVNAKLREDAVLDILTERMPRAAFAQLYGVSPITVRQIQAGRRWAHLSHPQNHKKRVAGKAA